MHSSVTAQFSTAFARLLAVATTLTAAGCTQPSLLITPVTARMPLVETELSRDSVFATQKIALIDVTGILINESRWHLLAAGEHPVSLLLEQLDKAGRDQRVKAVILRINSPGGGVVASELMYDEILHFRKSGKPVVAVMMDVAASGGYYIACACDEIVAQPSTVTGSIGVMMQMFDFSGTMSKIGIQSDAISSGTFKDIGSPFRTMRPEERELFQQIINEMYERFVDRVVAGRSKLDEPTVRGLADGRVFTASQARDKGLIDRIATMRDTISAIKKRIGSKRIRLVAYHRPLHYRPNYYAQGPAPSGGDVNVLNVDLPAWLGRTSPRFMYLWAPGVD